MTDRPQHIRLLLTVSLPLKTTQVVELPPTSTFTARVYTNSIRSRAASLRTGSHTPPYVIRHLGALSQLYANQQVKEMSETTSHFARQAVSLPHHAFMTSAGHSFSGVLGAEGVIQGVALLVFVIRNGSVLKHCQLPTKFSKKRVEGKTNCHLAFLSCSSYINTIAGVKGFLCKPVSPRRAIVVAATTHGMLRFRMAQHSLALQVYRGNCARTNRRIRQILTPLR